MSLFIAVLTIVLIILIHEAGHFTVAKALKVPVSEFSIGFGKALLSKKYNGTIYSLRLLPLGGFCRFGDEEHDVLSEQSIFKRVLICLAGSLHNIVSALIVAVAMCMFIGIPYATLQIQNIDNANVSIIQTGDIVTEINGTTVNTYSELQTILLEDVAETAEVTVRRGQEVISEEINMLQADGSYRLGFTFSGSYQKTSIQKSMLAGWNYFSSSVSSVFNSFLLLFSGKVGIRDLTGIVGIAATMSEAAKSDIYSMLSYFVLLSANIGIFNLLPIPALDGSKIIFAVLSGVFNKGKLLKIENILSTATMLLLIALMAVLAFKDVVTML